MQSSISTFLYCLLVHRFPSASMNLFSTLSKVTQDLLTTVKTLILLCNLSLFVFTVFGTCSGLNHVSSLYTHCPCPSGTHTSSRRNPKLQRPIHCINLPDPDSSRMYNSYHYSSGRAHVHQALRYALSCIVGL